MHTIHTYKPFPCKAHLACGNGHFREAYKYVHFIDDYLYATDGHILLKAKLDPEIAVLLNGKAIHYKAFEHATRCSHKGKMLCLIDEKGITISQDGLQTTYPFAVDIKAPAFEKTVKEAMATEKERVEFFVINGHLLARLQKAMGVSNHLKLHLYKPHRAIIVSSESNDDVLGLIMPIYISLP